MNEERKLILEMLKEGAVSVDEAERLLSALAADSLETNPPQEGECALMLPTAPGAAPLRPKRLLVNVISNGKPQVNIRLPFSLVRAGLKIGKTFTGISAKSNPEAAQAAEILQEIDIDELLDGISGGDITLPYTLVDVDDEEKDEHVRIVLE